MFGLRLSSKRCVHVRHGCMWARGVHRIMLAIWEFFLSIGLDPFCIVFIHCN